MYIYDTVVKYDSVVKYAIHDIHTENATDF